MGSNTQTVGSSFASGVSSPNASSYGSSGGNFGAVLDLSAMSTSQTFPMTPSGAQVLPWVGPAQTAPKSWLDQNSAVINVPAFYVWRFRIWGQTNPAAGGLKLYAQVNTSGMIVAQSFSVDDLIAAGNLGSNNRVAMWVPQSYASSNSGNPPTFTINLPTADATGVLRYDIACYRMIY